MRKLGVIAWNHLRIEFQDRSTLVFFLVLPLIFTIIVGSALGGGSSSGDNRTTLLVVDEDHSRLSTELSSALNESTVIQPLTETADEARQLFDDNKALAVLTIPAGFDAGLMAGETIDVNLRLNPNDNRVLAVQQEVRVASELVSGAVAAARAAVAEAEHLKPFADDAARQSYFEKSLAMAREVLQNPLARVEATQASQPATTQVADVVAQSTPGQLITWVLTTLLAASEFLVYGRLNGTARRLAVTPTSKTVILSGNIAGRLAMGLVQMILLIGFGALVLHVNWGQSPAALAVLVVTFALSAVGFGVMLATFVRTSSPGIGLTILFSMLFAALGGCWWPLEITPPIYQTVVKVLPSTWAMQGFTDLIVRGKGLIDILPIAGVLLLFTLVFMTIGIRRLRFD